MFFNGWMSDILGARDNVQHPPILASQEQLALKGSHGIRVFHKCLCIETICQISIDGSNSILPLAWLSWWDNIDIWHRLSATIIILITLCILWYVFHTSLPAKRLLTINLKIRPNISDDLLTNRASNECKMLEHYWIQGMRAHSRHIEIIPVRHTCPNVV